MKTSVICLLWAILIGVSMPLSTKGYSVLSHLAVIDAAWDNSIQPLLLKKYPGATADQLKEARSYAYGGSVAPDMGYFPLGNKLFTNLVHYVRTGDFVEALLNESQNINEYAFSLGVLAHYYADNYGHPIGVNPGVPIVYPKIKAKYGDVVTYAQNHISHTRMEFGFDVLQTARGNYEAQSYHNFIGFNVARPVLERAFLRTYGLDINKLFMDLSLSIATFRWTVKNLFPQITKAAWLLKSADIKKSHPGITARSFRYRMSRREYNKEFGRKRQRPGIGAGIMSMAFRIMPKRVVLRALRFKEPGAKAEQMFIKSFDTISVRYANSMRQIGSGHTSFPDLDFDTGEPIARGEYELTDETYDKLVIALQKEKFDHTTPDLQQNILTFYKQAKRPAKADKVPEEKVSEALGELKRYQPSKADTN